MPIATMFEQTLVSNLEPTKVELLRQLLKEINRKIEEL